MIEEQGVITACDGPFAIVETQRRSACAGCRLKAGCGTATLQKVLGQRRTHVKALNTHGARVGQAVVIGLNERAFLRGSFSLYAIPLLFMMTGALLGSLVGPTEPSGLHEALGIAGAALGFAAGAAWLRRKSAVMASDPAYQPVVLRLADDP